jgi:AcrR family transcriptional regulator
MTETGNTAATGLRERGKARRRAAIIRAAYELFGERGYDATTVADIAEAADVSPRTVAMYFPAKQDIALSRFDEAADSLTDAIRDRQPGETVQSVLGRWLRTVKVESGDRELYRLASRMFTVNPGLAALRAARIAAAVREGAALFAAESGVDPDAIGPRLAAAAAAAVTMEIVDVEPGEERERAVETAIRFLEGGIAAL